MQSVYLRLCQMLYTRPIPKARQRGATITSSPQFFKLPEWAPAKSQVGAASVREDPHRHGSPFMHKRPLPRTEREGAER